MPKQLKIGSLLFDNPFILAPMASITNTPFRSICYELGCGAAITEMIPSISIVRNLKRVEKLFYRAKGEKKLWVQLVGKDPEIMAQAAAIVEKESGADLLDINMGCPVKKVVSHGGGAALIKEPERARDIVKAVICSVSIPVTVKIRSGWNENIDSFELVSSLADTGIYALTVHGRTREQFYKGEADFNLIIRLKKEFPHLILIANGGIKDLDSTKKVFEHTGCDAIMIGRGALGNPWVFKSLINESDYTPNVNDLREIILKHLDFYIEYAGERRAVIEMRKHIGWYFKGRKNARVMRNCLSKLNMKEDIIKLINDHLS